MKAMVVAEGESVTKSKEYNQLAAEAGFLNQFLFQNAQKRNKLQEILNSLKVQGQAPDKEDIDNSKKIQEQLKEEIKLNQALIDVKIKENQAEQERLKIAIKFEDDLLKKIDLQNKLAVLQIQNTELVKDRQLEGLRQYEEGSRLHTAEVEKVMIDHNSKLESISSNFWMGTMADLQKSFSTRFKFTLPFAFLRPLTL
jgi:RNase H-fold protein (predicted Holliday junction resolvase)